MVQRQCAIHRTVGIQSNMSVRDKCLIFFQAFPALVDATKNGEIISITHTNILDPINLIVKLHMAPSLLLADQVFNVIWLRNLRKSNVADRWHVAWSNTKTANMHMHAWAM